MPLVRRRRVSLTLEHMSQVSTASRAHNLRPSHAKRSIGVSCDSAGDVVEVCGPSTAGLELVVGFVEGCVAAGAGVDTFAGHVFVVGAGVGSFGAFFAEDAELL